MNLKPMSLNLNSTSDKAATAKKVNVFHRPDLSELVLKTDAVFSGAIRNPFRLVDDIDMDVIGNLLLDYISTPHAQEILEKALNNLMSLKEKEVPEEFKSSQWVVPGSNLFDKLLSGIPFYSKLTPDYNITFNKTMHYFVSEELYDKFFSEAMMNLKNPKKIKAFPGISAVQYSYNSYLLRIDYDPRKLGKKYPDDPKKAIDSMVKLYRNYYDIEHFDIDAHAIATRESLLWEIECFMIATYPDSIYKP